MSTQGGAVWWFCLEAIDGTSLEDDDVQEGDREDVDVEISSVCSS